MEGSFKDVASTLVPQLQRLLIADRRKFLYRAAIIRRAAANCSVSGKLLGILTISPSIRK